MQISHAHGEGTAVTLIGGYIVIRVGITTLRATITAAEQTLCAESAISRARIKKRIQKGGFAIFLRKPPIPRLRAWAHPVSTLRALSRPPAHREGVDDSPEAEEPVVDEAVRGRRLSV